MKTLILTFVLFNTSVVLSAQDSTKLADLRPRNSISLNVLGDASIISANYERQFLISPTFLISSKLGLGYNEEFKFCFFGQCSPPKTFTTIPHPMVRKEFGYKGYLKI